MIVHPDVITRCSQARCLNNSRTHIAWWLPASKVPICDEHYVRWLHSLGITDLR